MSDGFFHFVEESSVDDNGGAIIYWNSKGEPGRWLRVLVVMGKHYKMDERAQTKYVQRRLDYLRRKLRVHFLWR